MADDINAINMVYIMCEEEYKDKVKLRASSNGIFLQLENTSYIIFNVFSSLTFFK